MNRRHPAVRWTIVLAAVVIAGCVTNQYEIELTPVDDSIQRELTCWRIQPVEEGSEYGSFPEDDLKRLAAVYDAAVPADRAKKHKFAGIFSNQLPDDVGNNGSYTHWDSPLGSASAYVERIRGNDDLVTALDERQKSVDQVANLLIGWLATELDGATGFAQLRQFLDNDLRRDLKNLSLYSWAWSFELASAHDGTFQPEYLVRAGQYFVERSYFAPHQVPALVRALHEAQHDHPAPLLALVQQFIASKMGIAPDQPIPPQLQFLTDKTAIDTSLVNYLRKTDDYQRLVKEWEQQKAIHPQTQKPEPGEVLAAHVAQAFWPSLDFGHPADHLNVKLATNTPPYQTNGQWDAEARQVTWSRGMPMAAADSKHAEIPTLLYACWSSPAEQVQQARFGRVVLSGSDLGQYCLWYRGLSPQEAREWDEFVSGLLPGDGLVERVRTFRFSADRAAKAADEDQHDLASTPRDLILSNLP